MKSIEHTIDNLTWIYKKLTGGETIQAHDMVLNSIIDTIEVLKGMKNDSTDMEKLQIENAELIQRICKLERELAKETSYNYALVTVIRNGYPGRSDT